MRNLKRCCSFIFNITTFKLCVSRGINYCRVRSESAAAKTWSSKVSQCDTHFSYFSSLEKEKRISILHQVWSWASGLMRQMVSRRQPIYRLVCMVDVTSGVSVVHQSPATQRSPTPALRILNHSVCLSGAVYLHTRASFARLILLSVCCLRAADVQASAQIKRPPAGCYWWRRSTWTWKEIPLRQIIPYL